MKKTESMAVQADRAMKAAVKKAIARQWQAGLPIHVVKNGKIVHLRPEAAAAARETRATYRTKAAK
ncbi:MAG TPA: hypothetical protein PKE26_03350 [Kiritimatiellia bacterium]|nr:hypothetical protein [Kiritimatiellia bacterium]HMO98125.1 hypothetical protein [Kiritimatiellia bacterium]HMP96182.1 hypothetical protein [Kiritimatiellia bacterium]